MRGKGRKLWSGTEWAADRIIGIDTASTRGWKVDQVSSNLKGPPGTKVKVV